MDALPICIPRQVESINVTEISRQFFGFSRQLLQCGDSSARSVALFSAVRHQRAVCTGPAADWLAVVVQPVSFSTTLGVVT